MRRDAGGGGGARHCAGHGRRGGRGGAGSGAAGPRRAGRTLSGEGRKEAWLRALAVAAAEQRVAEEQDAAAEAALRAAAADADARALATQAAREHVAALRARLADADRRLNDAAEQAHRAHSAAAVERDSLSRVREEERALADARSRVKADTSRLAASARCAADTQQCAHAAAQVCEQASAAACDAAAVQTLRCSAEQLQLRQAAGREAAANGVRASAAAGVAAADAGHRARYAAAVGAAERLATHNASPLRHRVMLFDAGSPGSLGYSSPEVQYQYACSAQEAANFAIANSPHRCRAVPLALR